MVIVGICWVFEYFDLFDIEYVVWNRVGVMNVVDENCVWGIKVVYYDGIVSVGGVVFV